MASISHSVSFHLCGGELQSVAVFGHARPCAEHNRGCDHEGPAAKDSSVGHKGCCEDATFIIDSDKYLYKISETVTIQAISDSLPLSNEAIALANPLAVLTQKQFFNYKPPLIERDITVLVQTFLI